MEIVVDAHVIWNILITVVLAPLGFLIRSVLNEQKRLDILVNKTREEVSRDYVTRQEIEQDFERLMRKIERIDEKIDRLQSKTYFQE